MNNIADDFYNPCLREATSYDRLTGYFSSTVYVLAWSALRDFLSKGGHIRVLCSPKLSSSDADHLELGYRARSDAELSQQLVSELEAMIVDERLRSHGQLLAALVASGRLDVRLATVARTIDAESRRMFHDKVGVFTDDSGDRVGFGGSMNETMNGLLHNVESISAWPSWEEGRDARRVEDASKRFEGLWQGDTPGVVVHHLPDAVKDIIERVAAESDVDAILDRLSEAESVREEAAPYSTLRDHQQEAVDLWLANDLRGLLSHATGSGKTRTGVACMKLAIDRGLTPVVVVPSTLLLEQWRPEIRDSLGLRPVLCGGGNSAWKDDKLARAAVDSDEPQVVLSVANTAASKEFLAQMRTRGDKVALFADEVHRLGSPAFSEILSNLPARGRLGLSATPERAGDPEGTQRLRDFFGPTIHSYSIADALRDGHLSAYDYDVEFVSLQEHEQDAWEDLTRRIKTAYARFKNSDGANDLQRHLQTLLIARARLVKNAAAKPSVAAELLATSFRPSHRWLVYCDNIAQVESTIEHLADRDIAAQRYYRGMSDDADQVLARFRDVGGIVVSIRCLDEGVDIPAADHALLLASSQNPREHIQRRGRVLRRAYGKEVAKLVDVITLPRTVDVGDDTWKVAAAEIARSVEFDSWARVPGRARRKLERKWVSLGLSLDLLDEARDAGIEDDEEEQNT